MGFSHLAPDLSQEGGPVSAPVLKVMVNRRKEESTLGSRSQVPRFQEAGVLSGPLCEPANSDHG